MSYESIANILHFELLSIAMLLLMILFFCNLLIYKRKLTDRLSIMLFASTLVSGLELARNYVEGNPSLSALSYILVCTYAILDLFITIEFSLFFLEVFGVQSRAKVDRSRVLLFWIPLFVFSVISITTPWTHLLFQVDASGEIQEMVLYAWLFKPLLAFYHILTNLAALYRCVTFRRSGKKMARTAIAVLIFTLLFVSTNNVQSYILYGTGSDDYISFSLAWAVAMTFLIMYVNTTSLIEKEAQEASAEQELKIAASIQSDALPDPAPEFCDAPSVSLRAMIKPALEVGGDFYDYFFLDEDRLCFLIADVSDKGVAAALFMMTAKTMLRDHAMESGATEEICSIVNHRLCEKNEDSMFATAWVGILNTKTLVLHYTNAGHTKPFFSRQGEELRILKETHGMPIASLDGMTYDYAELQLQEGDSLFLYTDGVTEATNPKKVLFGEQRVAEVLEQCKSEPAETVLAQMQQHINQFAEEEPQFDDITMMMVKIGRR